MVSRRKWPQLCFSILWQKRKRFQDNRRTAERNHVNTSSGTTKKCNSGTCYGQRKRDADIGMGLQSGNYTTSRMNMTLGATKRHKIYKRLHQIVARQCQLSEQMTAEKNNGLNRNKQSSIESEQSFTNTRTVLEGITSMRTHNGKRAQK